MIEKIQHATASSPEGAKGLVKGVLACAFRNMAFMLPTCLLYFLVKDLLNGTTSGKAVFYLLGCIVCFGLILLTLRPIKKAVSAVWLSQNVCVSCRCLSLANEIWPI